MKSFESWTFEDVQDTFEIRKTKDFALLKNWISATCKRNEFQNHNLNHLKNKISDYVDTWNEDELKLQFIGPFLDVVNYESPKYKAFSQRTLTLKKENINVGGRIDYMLARGLIKPKQPFFFFNEYKPSKRGNNDPLGQLLIEMIAGQYQNNNNTPIYGAYTEGRFWYFVVLSEKEYAVSPSYDATKDDIYQIYAILCKVKDYIEEILAK